MNQGKLYIVSTPIGNLEDITLRALRILKEVDYILCEDTRVTGKLLAHYEIKNKLRRYDAHSNQATHEKIIEDVLAGLKVALVSDAGTPGVSDPGVILVKKAREKEVPLEVVPGASAVTAAIALSGIAGNQFTFLGFVPHKKGRQTFFANLKEQVSPVVFYESPHRILKTLEVLASLPDVAFVTTARELTKIHETIISGEAKEVYQYYLDNPERVRGEFVVIVEISSVSFLEKIKLYSSNA
jgi:16S rRNA (cytidine1402-2'-O)-methyltransferase